MKRKMLNRLMAASLAAIMTVGMAGCGDNNEGSSENPGNSTQDQGDTGNQGDTENQGNTGNQGDVADGGEGVGLFGAPLVDPATGQTYDLGGMEIVIADWWSDPNGVVPEPTTEFGEIQLEYHEWLQETYNFTMVQKKVYEWGDAEGAANYEFVQAATSTPTENIIYILTPRASVVSAMNQGLMYDISTLDCLDLTEPKWTSSGEIYNWRIGDHVYCFYADKTEPRNGVWFNKRLVEEAGYPADKIYDWQANGEWTWDKMVEIMAAVQQDTNNDGEIDVWGCVMDKGQFIMSAIYSNGGSLVDKNDDGTFYLTVNSDATTEALHWAMDDVIVPYFHNYDPDGSNWILYRELFKTGDAAFMVEGAYAGYGNGWLNGEGDRSQAMEDDFGFVMFPKGPRANDYVTNAENNPIAIPASYDEDTAWKIMFAYNLWTEPIPGWENYFGIMDNCYAGFRDDRSVDETITMMPDRGVMVWHSLISGLDTGSGFLWDLWPGNDVDAVIESRIVPWQTLIEETNASILSN